ncbi:hypothetical protein [Chryseobacterium indologenes]|uniref:Uncharacterized protein n=1 Tax=Chryseobacterium indologenes TaxID=253 RepID=A0A0N0ZXK5_CHRID|nr:hypothetical protein [Chryseobacterium indologenes]KPE50737.1 hypothetical protein AOB46_13175 [Chryseobacterium indologenes]
MKNTTLIAIISLIVIVLIDFVQIVLSFFEVYSLPVFRLFGVLNLIAFAGLLPFFITLYKKQK